jgi:membrane carboxypeptidase/penicillin-binding protein PbpC
LRIASPAEGESLVALNGKAVVTARAGAGIDLRWFLNGRFIGEGNHRRIELAPGRYELRCVQGSGTAACSVRFEVRPDEADGAISAAEPLPGRPR